MKASVDSAAERIVLDALGGVLSGIPAGAIVAIAYSGGLDSTVLLDAAVRVAGAARCVALHVHHGLSPNADRWLSHCEASAHAMGVRFDAEHVRVRRENGESLEAAARDARYKALDAMCARQGAAALWLAHHADDQAETVLLQLLRGAGVAGLAAMAPQRTDESSAVPRVRPFLPLLRAQLERYAHLRGLRWIEDESNADTRYARNALRHDVLPVLATRFPGFRDALSRTARHAATAQRLLDDLARIDLRTVGRDDGAALSRKGLTALDDARAMNLMRVWIRAAGLPIPSAARLADMLRQLREARNGHGLGVMHGGARLRMYRDKIYWEQRPSEHRSALESLEPLAPHASREARDEMASPPSALYPQEPDGIEAHDFDADSDAASGAGAPKRMEHLDWSGQQVWHLPQWRGSIVFVPAADDDTGPDTVSAAVLASATLCARSRTGGERMQRMPGGAARTLKNLFQELGVPAWERDVPLIYVGDALLFVPRLGLNGAVEQALPSSKRRGERRRLEWRLDLLIA
ncbi:tRNA lysidine(34) synthetase TilS [Trinickia dinghuensis]|uniref:tRNA(Ile)-lysidine synthase n=1 Tax=Trinickia dinghuensis TaxID=2291023 RepID=A0A3D8JZ14_9BURK|nr:tRNA lysidine(34) synthetase TilS [Trinickia dinghuensis]RDU97865.1 tRNA lysidine(34) synthetase TilS [Trinickia dinghuensis]